jgi:hypothetical protein
MSVTDELCCCCQEIWSRCDLWKEMVVINDVKEAGISYDTHEKILTVFISENSCSIAGV